MRVLVTGGAGYIGRFCVRSLLSEGHVVVVVDRASMPLIPLPPASELTAHQADIADTDRLVELMIDHRIGSVLHLAADKSVEKSMRLPGSHLQNNLCGTISLLEAMRLSGPKKVVFSSSAAVYGTPVRVPVTEDAALAPENPYGASKAMAEEVLRWYAKCHGFDTVSLRYFNAAGAADDGSLGEDAAGATNLIPRIMSAANGSGPPIQIFGIDYPTPDGTAVRDYVHVEDLATAHSAALAFVEQTHGSAVVNVGRGVGVSVRQMLTESELLIGRPVPALEAPRRPGDPAEVWADVTQAATLLGWRATRGLDAIVRSAWEWHGRGASRRRDP